MAHAMPAIRGQMGSTPYYLTTVRARTLTAVARPARETDAWASASIDERMQREFDMNRVKKAIVPYLAQHPDRFFGAVIVLVEKGAIDFEPLETLSKLPNAYRTEGQRMGFLTIDEGEHIVLDGQHRWLALRETITSAEPLGQYQGRVGDDEISVIFIEFEDARKTRRIFNKVNRHAKPTGRSDNILTSEDDGYAWVTRRLLDKDEGAPLAPRSITDGGATVEQDLVNWKSTTLSKGMRHLTTISAVYDSVKSILTFEGIKDFDRIVTPSEDELRDAYEKTAPWWEILLKECDAFREILDDLESVKTRRFDDDDAHTLLLRPVGQIALVRGIVHAMDRSRDHKTRKPKLSLSEAIGRINRIDWYASPDSIWRDTIVRADGRMVARAEAYNLAANLLAYLIAPEYTDTEMKNNLHVEWNRARGKDLDTPIETLRAGANLAALPEDLPKPAI